MNINLQEIVTVASLGLAVAVPVLAWFDKLPSVRKNKGLATLMDHVTAAAGQLAIEVPPGTSAAAVETMAVAKAAPIVAKFTGISQAEVSSLIVGGLGQILPPGHIVSGTVAVSEGQAVIESLKEMIADLKASAQPAAAAVTPAPMPAGAPPATTS